MSRERPWRQTGPSLGASIIIYYLSTICIKTLRESVRGAKSIITRSNVLGQPR